VEEVRLVAGHGLSSFHDGVEIHGDTAEEGHIKGRAGCQGDELAQDSAAFSFLNTWTGGSLRRMTPGVITHS